jgi:7-cyano-7-deazaguanine synthase in queuosine biosynthesis
LLAFSGGLDSTACAIRLNEQDYNVTLGYVDWQIKGSRYGILQRRAALRIAAKLDLPLKVLATCQFPEDSHAKWAWVQTVIAMVLYHAAAPESYPDFPENYRRYESVAFGLKERNVPDEVGDGYWDVQDNQVVIKTLVKQTFYTGDVLFPIDDTPHRRDIWLLVPEDIRPLVWSCYRPQADDTPCGLDSCYKCAGDKQNA